jgi:hypothetical protein
MIDFHSLNHLTSLAGYEPSLSVYSVKSPLTNRQRKVSIYRYLQFASDNLHKFTLVFPFNSFNINHIQPASVFDILGAPAGMKLCTFYMHEISQKLDIQ